VGLSFKELDGIAREKIEMSVQNNEYGIEKINSCARAKKQ